MIFGQGRRANTDEIKINMKEDESAKEYKESWYFTWTVCIILTSKKTYCRTKKQSYFFTFKENEMFKFTMI